MNQFLLLFYHKEEEMTRKELEQLSIDALQGLAGSNIEDKEKLIELLVPKPAKPKSSKK